MQKLLRNPQFRILWLAQAVSSLGNPFTAVAVSWLVYQLTGSKAALGGVLVANALPLMLLRLVVGPLVDRWDRRVTMIVADFVRAASLLIVTLLYWSGTLGIWHLIAVNAVNGAAEAFFGPASFALLPRIVPANQLVGANSFANMTTSLAMMVGPLLAGFTVEQAGVPVAFLFDAITFLFSGFSIILLAPQPPERRIGRSYLEELGEGLLFFRRFTVLLWFQAMAAMTNLGFFSATALSAPFAKDILRTDAAGYGMLYTSGGVGMLLGSLIAPLFRRFPMYRVMTLSSLLGGAALTGFALTRVLPQSMVVLVCFGGSVAVWNAFSAALYQRAVPDRLRGRVQSFRLLVSQGTMPIGYALAGVMADSVGLVPTLLLTGASIVVFTSVSFAIPSVARLDQVVLAAAKYAEASPPESATAGGR